VLRHGRAPDRLLEPTLVELLGATCLYAMAETVNEAERRGIDRKAAISFLTGHIYNLTANFLGLLNARVSDACLVAIGLGNRLVLRDDWKRIWDDEVLDKVIATMLHPGDRRSEADGAAGTDRQAGGRGKSKPTQSAVEFVVSSIKQLIIGGDLVPGDRLPSENEMTKLLSVSRSSLREAKKVLSMLGVVEIRRGDGTYVTDAATRRPSIRSS
jgi:hypothetical protein